MERTYMSDNEQILYRMLLCRRFEEEIISRYSKQLIRCPVHLGINQEAIAVGACFHLRKEDSVFSTHRNHSHYLAKGGNLERFTLEIYGKVGGCNNGRGGSMHALDADVNFFSCPIVASAIPLAVGAAMANKIDGKGNIVVCFFGDAAVEEGVFHESMNFASLHQLPIIFVCENNQYSVDTHISKRQPDRSYEDIARAYKISHWGMLGENVFILANAFKQVIDEVRKGKPYFVDVLTERSYVHCGVDKEFELKNDPLDVCKGQYEGDILARIKSAFDAAEAAPLPTPDMAKEHVYANVS
jgi:pyruvate dehydrogenase E1 component alpha subunit